MALRQVTGLLLNGELLIGPLIWLGGDVFAGTAVLHDPNQVLHR
jgi:hypothetical protein